VFCLWQIIIGEQGNGIDLRQTLFMHNALLKVALRTVSVTGGQDS
jgi:hypothetical protein